MHLGLMGKSGEINPLKTPFRGMLMKSTVRLCVVRVSEAFHFQFTTNFLYLYNLSIYDETRITYEPLLATVFDFILSIYLSFE